MFLRVEHVTRKKVEGYIGICRGVYSRVRVVFVSESCLTRLIRLHLTNSLLFSLTRLNQTESKTLVVRVLKKKFKVMVGLVLLKEKRKSKATQVEGNS